MPSNKITFSLYRQEAAEEGETPAETQLTNTNNLTISVYNETSNKNIEDFTVQYPYINLGEGMSNAGDIIRFSLIDKNGSMTAQDAKVTLDDTRCGSFKWKLIQNGSIRIHKITSSEEKTIMIFENVAP